MKFSCEKYVLEDAIRRIQKAVSPKNPIVPLRGFKVFTGARLRLTAYDLRRGIFTDIDADVERNGSAIFNARLFSDIVRSLPDGIVTITVEDDLNVLLKCGIAEFRFIAMRGDEYPELPEPDRAKSVDIPQKLLRSMIGDCLFAVSENETRPVYTGGLFEIEGDNITLVAVDGFRLAKRTEKLPRPVAEKMRFIIPGYALSDVEKTCEEVDETAEISVGTKHVEISIGDTVIITRLLEGEFLNHEKAIPRDFRSVFKVNRQDFMRAIDRVATIIDDEKKPIRLIFGDGVIDLMCQTAISRSSDRCICEGTAEDVEIGFNDDYLRDALRIIKEDEIEVCINTGSSPCVMRSASGDETYLYMVLPVRLNPGV